MKNFLAIDTSSKYLTVLAVKDGRAYHSRLTDCAMRHSTLLMREIDRTLKEADAGTADFDFFAAVVGAGSFTGIRIGVATAKGFALAAGKPTLPVTSFEVAAYNALDGEKPLCVVDALHGRYYVCGFSEEKKQTFPPSYLTESEVLSLAEVGGYTLYALEELPLSEKTSVKIADPVQGLRLAVSALSENAANFGELKALYIRKSQAEENLSAAKSEP